MNTWDLNKQLENNEISIIYGFNGKNIIIISEKELEKIKENDCIEFGIQTLKVKKELKTFAIPNIDSTININKKVYVYEVDI